MDKNSRRVRFYVDGLNLYYGVARPYNTKWIDLEKLLMLLVRKKIPEARAEKIFLFTSTVMGKGEKPNASDRQQTYFRALRAHSPKIKIILGYFTEHAKSGQCNHCNRIESMTILEEKMTDVNLACQIVYDAHTSDGKSFDISCLVSNDSDLACAIEIKKRLGQRILLIAPKSTTSQMSRRLIKHVPKKDRIATIKKVEVEQSLLPQLIDNTWYPPNAPGWQ